jgi:TonB family protein
MKTRRSELVTTAARWIVIGVLAVHAVAAPSRLLGQQPQGNVDRKAVQKVAPSYPEIARRLKLRGTVRVAVKVGRDGRVTSAKVIGGHPLLARVAVDAVRQWRYEPTSQQTSEVAVIQFEP